MQLEKDFFYKLDNRYTKGLVSLPPYPIRDKIGSDIEDSF